MDNLSPEEKAATTSPGENGSVSSGRVPADAQGQVVAGTDLPEMDGERGQSAGQATDGSQPGTGENGIPGGATTPAGRRRPIIVMPQAGESDMARTPVSPTATADAERPAQSSSAAVAAEAQRRQAAEQRVRPDLRHHQVVQGSHPGDRFVRYERNIGPFRRRGSGVLAASLATDVPRGRWGRSFARLKRVVLGSPISTEHSAHERLTKFKALAVLSSDALSSVAYATEEILRILILAGTAALSFAIPLGIAIIILMVIVVSSYRQTIAAYPRGGGTYIVAKDNLGTLPGLTAAASILIGYTLTVAVSVAAGIAAIYSLSPSLRPYRVELCLVVILFVTVANLRGLREAGNIFAVPTYLFIVGIVLMVGYGLLRLLTGIGGELVYVPPDSALSSGAEAVSLVLLLRAFTQGAAALTGVEAIADGVPAFKPPEARNARQTLVWMAAVAITMFAGITFLATHLGVLPSDKETVVSQIARTVFGRNELWFAIQIATALILVLAANTAFADFPRLSYFLARDGYMPHQYTFRGDKLAFSWGIVTLAALASVLIIIFDGDTSALIPLYAVGVFGAFTFSQSGMVVRWWRLRPPGWQRNLLMNGIGAVTTLTVFAVATLTKLQFGTWIVLIVIPIMILIFLAIHRHYAHLSTEVESTTYTDVAQYKHTFIVPIAKLNPVALSALAYARSLSSNVTAVHILEGEDPEEAELFLQEWHKAQPNSDVPMVIIESPYRSLIGPLLSYIDALDQQSPDDTITIVVPEFLPARPWEYLLHNQTALRLKASLLFRPNTVVVSVPYLLGRRAFGGALAGGGPVFGSVLAGIPWVPLLVLVALLTLLYFLVLGR